MRRPKDRMELLFPILASGDQAKVRVEASKLLKEIDDDIRALNREARLIREMVGRYGGAVDGLTSKDRSAKVRDAALALAAGGRKELTSQDVIDYLADKEAITFDVRRPASMAGSILTQMPEFRRIAMNRFQFVGQQQDPQGGSSAGGGPIEQQNENS
jgi:RecB family exonuclease